MFEADPAEDMERLGITRRKSSDGKQTGKIGACILPFLATPALLSDNGRRRLTRPLAFDNSLSPGDTEHTSNGSESPRLALDDDDVMMPRRTSTTPDLLKGSRPVVSIPYEPRS